MKQTILFTINIFSGILVLVALTKNVFTANNIFNIEIPDECHKEEENKAVTAEHLCNKKI